MTNEGAKAADYSDYDKNSDAPEEPASSHIEWPPSVSAKNKKEASGDYSDYDQESKLSAPSSGKPAKKQAGEDGSDYSEEPARPTSAKAPSRPASSGGFVRSCKEGGSQEGRC